ncbi:MAG: single-stranded-DNA-specific exonuclease RecJ, partial [Planctomycetes bacterium]|nr:single-stranded-DNA-specific exonuclease RecJ [Planctomycetota bacterium]
MSADTPGDLEPLVRRVLASRGLSDPDQADAFLNPSLLDLHDPSLIPDLDRAAERLLGAARGGEPIVIYGDYDVDGIAATAIVYHLL